MYYVVRNNQQYGPYSVDSLRQYVEGGQLLLHDSAFEATIRAIDKLLSTSSNRTI